MTPSEARAWLSAAVGTQRGREAIREAGFPEVALMAPEEIRLADDYDVTQTAEYALRRFRSLWERQG